MSGLSFTLSTLVWHSEQKKKKVKPCSRVLDMLQGVRKKEKKKRQKQDVGLKHYPSWRMKFDSYSRPLLYFAIKQFALNFILFGYV